MPIVPIIGKRKKNGSRFQFTVHGKKLSLCLYLALIVCRVPCAVHRVPFPFLSCTILLILSNIFNFRYVVD
jgi:hypothetical protein